MGSTSASVSHPTNEAYGNSGLNFEDIFKKHSRELKTYALSLTRNPDDANDLSQETFFRAWFYRHNYKDGDLRAWLYRIMHNEFVDKCRASGKVQTVTLEDYVNYIPDANAYSDPDNLFADKETDVEVVEALNGISQKLKDVMLLYLDDFSYEDIARTLRIPLGTVKSRLYRCRKLLEHNLSEYA